MRSEKHIIKNLIRKNLTLLACAFFAAAAFISSQAYAQSLTDPNITSAVEDEILFDMAVDLNDIDVKTTNGVVELTGVVDNILAKERVAKIAQMVKGVRSVVNLVQVVPPLLRSDGSILHDVEVALLRDPATKSYAIKAEVEDNVVTLTGTLGSWAQRNLAEKVVKGVRGVKEVKNKIDIDYKTIRTDPQIKKEVKNVLAWDTLVDDGRIDVDVNKGVVRLSGYVGSAAEKLQAVIKSWVIGAKNVDDSELKVRKWARIPMLREKKYVFKSEDEIKKAINAGLLHHPRVLSFEINPIVNKGVVTLRGVVDNLSAKQAAESVARRTVGVSAVKNRIKVRPEKTTDSEISTNVRKAIGRNPILDRDDIVVTVDNGTAYLYGEVDSYFEKGHANLLAAHVYGVKRVKNNLAVARPRPLAYNPYLYNTFIYDDDWYDYQPVRSFKPDDEIEKSIKSNLWWSPYVNRADVTIEVKNGTVTLEGKVDTLNEWYEAMEEAYKGGAVWVKNEMEVK